MIAIAVSTCVELNIECLLIYTFTAGFFVANVENEEFIAGKVMCTRLHGKLLTIV